MRRAVLIAVLFAGALAAQPPAPGTGVIRGVVLNAQTNAPVRRATIILIAPQIRLTADSDGEGKFEFTALPPGTYRLSASRTGFTQRPAKRPVALGAGESAQTEIRLPPRGSIAGHVVDESGEGMDHARVGIYRQSYREGRKFWERLNLIIPTDDRGQFRFPDLIPGRYLLQAWSDREPVDNQYGSPPQSFYTPAYYHSAPDQQQAAPVALVGGVELTGVDIRLVKVARPPAVRVRGRVTGMPPDPQFVLYVGVIPPEGSLFGGGGTAVKGPDYAFEFTAPAGAYLLSGNVYSGGPESYGRVPLTLTRDVSDVVLPMSPAPRLNARFRVAEDGIQVKLQSIQFDLELQRSNLAHTYGSDASGRILTNPLRPGRYSISRMRSLPDGCYVREMRLGDQPIDPAEFEVNASAELDIVLSCTAGRITGTVLDAEGKPHPGSTVTLMPSALKVEVDDSGAFHFDSLRPGKYTLFAWEEVDDDLWPDSDYLKKYEGQAVEVEVGPRETKSAQLRAIAP